MIFIYLKINNMEWFIQIHRKILEWWWYNDINVKVLFLHILFTANYTEKVWRWVTILPWQLLSWRKSLSKDTWLTESQVRTALDKLISTWEIAINSTNEYSILTLNNWDTYNQPIASKIANESPTNRQRIATTNNINKVNKEIIDTTLIFQDHIKTDTASITSLAIKYFLLLWWIPAKDETVDTFRNWIKETFEANWIKDPNKMKYPLDTWYMFWKEQKKSKNLKNTFATTIKFSLPKN